MASLEWKLMLQFFLLLVVFILGFLICIPIGISKSDFDGNCLLYADIKVESSSHYRLTEFGSTSSCNYVIYAGVSSLLLGCLMLLGSGYFLYRNFKEKEQLSSSWVASLIQFVTTVLMGFFVFVAACIISVGRNSFCSSAVDTAEKQGVKLKCQDIEKFTLNKKPFPAFYSKFKVAEVSAWLSVFIWIGLVVLSAWRIMVQRRARGGQNKDPATVAKKEGYNDYQVPKAI